jgi:hypothetical protein
MKVIHTHSIFYQFSKPAFAFVSDLSWEYDNIAEANEIKLPYISYVYGKSKSHFKRISGCLWCLELAFIVLDNLKTIPTNCDEFINTVNAEVESINESLNTTNSTTGVFYTNQIDLNVVTAASKVMQYFIDHKLILSDMERDDETNEYSFIKTASDVVTSNTLNSSNAATSTAFNSSNYKKVIKLETLILLQKGRHVYLTPLVKGNQQIKINTNTFRESCLILESKGLGEFGKKTAGNSTSRASFCFIKASIPDDEEEVTTFVNNLFYFGCSLENYTASLKMDDIFPTPTQSSNSKEDKEKKEDKENKENKEKKKLAKNLSFSNDAVKRTSNFVSLDNIEKESKNYKGQSSEDE